MQNALELHNEELIGTIDPADPLVREAIADLNVYIEQFNSMLSNIEKRCVDANADPGVLFHDTAKAIVGMRGGCQKFEQIVAHDPALLKRAQDHFRAKTSPFFRQSVLSNHARTWPLGYAGDYKLLEHTYRNTPLSSGIGYFLDLCFLSMTLGIAVRERLRTLGELLRIELKTRSKPRILNVACGSCRELFDIAPEFITSEASAICIDFDPNALKYASEQLSYASIAPERIKFTRYNAFKMVNHARNLTEFGNQDIIYSTGFFDYVNDEVLVRLLSAAYQLLSPGGRLIASFKDSRRYTTQEYHWFVKWDAFLQRTEKDSDDLFEQAGILRSNIRTLRDRSGVINFYIVTK
jgi:SAM-dependent methyltransferase